MYTIDTSVKTPMLSPFKASLLKHGAMHMHGTDNKCFQIK